MGFTDEQGNGAREEDMGLRSGSQFRSKDGLGIVIEVLNFDRRSLPRMGMGHFGSMRKE